MGMIQDSNKKYMKPFFDCKHKNIAYDKKAHRDKCLDCGQHFNLPNTQISHHNVFNIGSKDILPTNWYIFTILFPDGTTRYKKQSTCYGIPQIIDIPLDVPEKQTDPRLQWDNHLEGKDLTKYNAKAIHIYGTVYRVDPGTLKDARPGVGWL